MDTAILSRIAMPLSNEAVISCSTMEYLRSRRCEIFTLAHKRSNTSGMSTLEDVIEGKDYNFPVEV